MDANNSIMTTRSIVVDYINWRLNKNNSINYINATDQRICSIVREVGSECERLYEPQISTLNFPIPTLSIDRDTMSNLQCSHSELAKEMFNDGQVTWGRILTLISFSAILCEHVARHYNNLPLDNIISSVVEWTVRFFYSDLGAWFHRQNGWAGFLDFYDNQSPKKQSIGRYATILGSLGVIILGAMHIRQSQI